MAPDTWTAGTWYYMRLVMDPDRPTGTCVVMITHKGEHTMLSDPGANAALSPDDLPLSADVAQELACRLQPVRGAWPGDETDEEIDQALRELS